MLAKKLKGVFAAGLLFCMGATCSPLSICYNDSACADHERCFKGDEETSAVEGICVAPSCEPACKDLIETCVWDTVGWEAHCVVL